MIEFVASASLPTHYADFTVHVFLHNKQEHLVLTKGKFDKEDSVLTRIHSECLTGDGLFSLRCDCGPQLEFAMQEIGKRDKGMIIYLRQEGRGIGLLEKIKAYELQDHGVDTFDANIQLGHAADNRNYGMLTGVFEHFGVSKVDIMTNNPDKMNAIKEAGVTINQRIALKVGHTKQNETYIKTKIEKFNHLTEL